MTRTAILIGVGAYDTGDFPALASPGADINAIAASLRRNCSFDRVRVLLNPTKARALEEIEAPLVGGDRDDLVFLSFSGHGFQAQRTRRLHLALRDTRKDRPSATAISAVELQNVLRDSPVTSKMLLLDCCYSGAFADGFGTRAADGDDPGIDFQRQLQGKGVGEGTYVLAACGAFQRAYEGDNSTKVQPSAFSAAVAEGLAGAAEDANGDGWSDGPDLYQYVHRKVEGVGQQTVTAFALGMSGTIRLARHASSLTATPLAGTSVGPPPEHTPRVGEGRNAALSTGDGAQTGPVRFPGLTPLGGSSSNTRSSPDFSRVIDYLHACVSRDSVLQQLPRIDGNEVAVCPVGSEPLLTGALSRWLLSGDGAIRVADQAVRSGHVLRYGYPAVLFGVRGSGRGRDTRVAPLFVVDAEVVTESGHQYLTPVQEPELNRALLTSAADLSQEDVAELMAWFQADWAGTGVSGLSDKARQVCDRLGLRVLDPLEAGSLGNRINFSQPYRTGVQNIALLYRANPADKTAKQILSDLDRRGEHGIRIEKIPKTALAAFDIPIGDPAADPVAEPAPSRTGTVLPVVTGRSNTAQERIVAAAMTQPLTVVTGAPGTGKSTLITAQVTTAIAAGQSVLVASTNNEAVDVVVRAVNSLLSDCEVMVRTGNADKRSDEVHVLTRMRALKTDLSDEDTATAGYHLADVQRRLDEAHDRLTRIGAAEHRLALSAVARERVRKGLPSTLVLEELGDTSSVQLWRERLEKAVRPGWFRAPNRWWNGRLIRRRLGVGATPDTADALLPFLELEQEWLTHLREAVEAGALGNGAASEQHQAVARAREERRSHSHTYLLGGFARALAMGRPVLERRLQSLHSREKGWPGFDKLVRTVRAWATTSRSVRGTLPPRAGLFDLVIVDEASQCTAADLVPLLYRAKRALVIGDPHQLQPVNTLEADEDCRLQAIAGLEEEWLQERGLVFTRTSAYHVAASAVTRAGGDVHWLDEHYRCHPDIIRPANSRFYGDRLSVRTPVGKPVASDAPAVHWIDVKGATDRPGGRSCRNVKEAELVVELLRQLWRELPTEATIGVVTPFKAQRNEIARQLTLEAARRIEVGTIHTFQGRECDAVVISPAAAAGVRRSTGHWVQRQQNLWNVAVTRAKSRLYVVGDIDYWTKQEGLLADYAHPAEKRGAVRAGVDEARQRLFSALLAIGAAPRVGMTVGGYACDLWTDTPGGPRAVMIDDAGVGEPVAMDHGHRLERVLDGAALFESASGVPTVRVPVWRCLAEPGSVAEELAGAR